MSILHRIHAGKRTVPDRVLLYGVEGVGKSTFAADAPGVLFLAAEEGVAHLDVESIQPTDYQDVLSILGELATGEHSYKTLAIDTLDWIEPLIWQACCQSNGWKSIEDPGYGKGYTLTVDYWRRLLQSIDTLQAKRGLSVVMLAHASIRPFKNPNGADFDRYEPKLHKHAAALIKEWCRSVLFATHEEFARKDQQGRVKGVSTGRRVVYTTRNAAWDAKNRSNLPAELPLSWADYVAARDRNAPSNPSALADEARALLTELDPDATMRATVAGAIEGAATDAAKLAKIVDRLRSLVAEKQGE